MSAWHVNILTLFPEMFPGTLGHSLSGRALENGIWSYKAINIRDFGLGVHKTVDDTPYGGGAGMVMRADVIEAALLECRKIGKLEENENPKFQHSNIPNSNIPNIYLTPRGKPLTQAKVQELAALPAITILCGRYEGVDQRVLEAYNFEEISIGDYVLSGGEPAALILMDACIRLLPGVMGNAETAPEESFSPSRGGLLEYPHYTKPAEWTAHNGEVLSVPDVLRSGNHAEIEKWRHKESINITEKIRPDLLKK
jgi:tRNA (guanine37-N1)-methyltransferase